MKILHYIPSIDRTSGGTTTYLQMPAKELGNLAELHIVSHASDNPVKQENCQMHFIASWKHIIKIKRRWNYLLMKYVICSDKCDAKDLLQDTQKKIYQTIRKMPSKL